MIELKNVCKKYGDKVIYERFDFSFKENEITAVLGASGAGKTTLLNMVAGLTEYDGEIKKDGDISFVFQTDRLIKNLTVGENLKLIAPNADVSGALKNVGLSGAENTYPKELSAGMARRVAILRAFLYPSKILLMDEPFINLDLSLEFSLMDTVKEMMKTSPKTVLFVTHDVKEAVYLADRAVVLSEGKVVYDNREITDTTEKELIKILLSVGNKG